MANKMHFTFGLLLLAAVSLPKNIEATGKSCFRLVVKSKVKLNETVIDSISVGITSRMT